MSGVSKPGFVSQYLDSFLKGSLLMFAQSPFVNACNRVSVVGCHENLSTIRAAQRIYSGVIDRANHPSLWHFQRGYRAYIGKELARLGFKPWGLIVLRPALYKHYEGEGELGALKAGVCFAGFLSLFEGVIQPADTVRTLWQSGKTIRGSLASNQSLMRYLYAGAFANISRQFNVWLSYTVSHRFFNRITQNFLGKPHAFSRKMISAVPVGFCVTLFSYPLERVKNELQYHPKLIEQAREQKKSRYRVGLQNIIKTQGMKGMTRGFFAKGLGICALVVGVDALEEWKKRGIT